MNFDFLPVKYKRELDKIDNSKIYEIRLRVGYKPIVNFNNKNQYLSSEVCTSGDLISIIKNVTEHSLYAYNDKLINGYLPYAEGVRIGVAGEVVKDRGQVITIKNFTSINIRVPHFIKDCAKKIIQYIYSTHCFNNTLIMSPPFCGKTTILKDIILKLNEIKLGSILVIDERGEFLGVEGEMIDKISYCNKDYAFINGIRALSPSILVTDELYGVNDWDCINRAVKSGIKVIATCHAKKASDLTSIKGFTQGVFERVISLKDGLKGKIECVYNEELKVL